MFARPSGPRVNLLLLVIFVLIIFFCGSSIFYKVQDDQPFTCRTWEDCGFQERPQYSHEIPDEPQLVVDQAMFHDGTTYYTRENLERLTPKLLMLVVNRDAHSWGADTLSSGRTITDFFDLLIKTDLDFTEVSIGLLTSDVSEFEAIRNATRSLPFARATVLHQPPRDQDPAESSEAAEVQRRRADLARARNYLMLRTLRDEPHIVWIDSDIVEFSSGLVQTLMSRAEADDTIGLITARCTLKKPNSDYDLRAWQMDREVDAIMGAVPVESQVEVAQTLVDTRRQAGQLVAGTRDEDLVALDSVGGTILYIRSSIVHLGVNFPPFHVVGTMWDHDGWAGLETEGICYMAKRLARKGCYLLGGNHHVRHADMGSSTLSGTGVSRFM